MSSLLEWIVANKEWLFSGVVVAVIGFILKQFFAFKRKKLTISYSYTRAFGASQVPLFLRAMASEYPLNALAQLHAKKKESFWATWPHKNCTIIETSAYKELFDENTGFFQHSQHMLETVSLENPVSADFYKTQVDYDLVDKTIPDIPWWVMSPFRKYEIFREVVPGPYSIAEVEQAVTKASEEIGFLLLFMKNESNQPLNDIRLVYKDIGHPDPLKIALNQKFMMTPKSKEMIIKYIKPQEELLLLLEVYRKDANGYPYAYYSSLNLPNEIRTQSGLLRLKIKPPNRDKAAKIPFPFGWTGQ